MTSTTHIAGPRIEACGRIIQRCSLCGEKLCDSKNVAMPLEKCQACDGTGGYQPAYVSGGEIVGPDVCHDCGGTGDKPPRDSLEMSISALKKDAERLRDDY